MTGTTGNTTQEEKMSRDSLSENSEHLSKNINQILVTQHNVEQIKKNIERLIEAQAQNPSLFSRISQYWGTLPLWKKISAGVILIAPTLIIGIAAQVPVLLTICFFTLFTYSLFSYLFDNHHNQNEANAHRLQKSISSLVDTLESVIVSLTLLHEQLAEQIELFQQENEHLTLQISQLTEQIVTLSNQTKQLMETEHNLRTTQKELEQSSKTLESSLTQQSELLQKSQKKLVKVTQDYEKTQSELSEKVIELSHIKVAMNLAVEKAKHTVGTLQGTVEMLTNNVIADGERRSSFQQRLNDFLNNKEKSFDQVAERICDAEHKLAFLSERLKDCNLRYQELLDQQEHHVERLQGIKERPLPEHQTRILNQATNLNILGIYAVDVPLSQPDTEFTPYNKTTLVH
ncbi:membrane protein [Legionella antarctica]|uniref:Membrane protein n=1 Tax=Legionella antarctica TaxID=2708020 RepID=A0A6F8T1S6_9GAMM|nr:LegC2/C7 family Dot/Icm T4SS effector [Legionella antarctica]BCA94634.1 membrane protein [Legionella antarctica]